MKKKTKQQMKQKKKKSFPTVLCLSAFNSDMNFSVGTGAKTVRSRVHQTEK